MKVEKKCKISKPSRRTNNNGILQDITSSLGNADKNSSASKDFESSTPNSSQSTTQISSPASSPQEKTYVIRQPTKQALLSFGIEERKQCNDCGMSYLKNVQSDIKIHHKYHQKCLNGRDWSENWGEKLVSFGSNQYICCVNPKNLPETKAALELLEIVNRDLNAPDDNEFWMKNEDLGKVFVYVKDKRAIGIVSIERIKSGKWFSVDDGKVVSKIDVELLAGISRIYVSKNFRRSGIALHLLQTSQKHLIYGLIVPKSKYGWSQPSSSGGKLAKQFNGVKHKSGKILIPVYT